MLTSTMGAPVMSSTWLSSRARLPWAEKMSPAWGLAAIAQQRLGDVHRMPGQPGGQTQQGSGVVGVTGGGPAALQQLPGEDGALAALGPVRGAIDQGIPLKAEHRVAEGEIRPALQCRRKIGEGGAQAFPILGRQHHAVQPSGRASRLSVSRNLRWSCNSML